MVRPQSRGGSLIPFGGLLTTTAIGAGGQVLGGLLGGKGASSAANKLRQGQIQGANYAQGAVGTGQGSIEQGMEDLAGSAQAGQGTVAGAGTEANDALQKALATQLGYYSPYMTAGQTGLNGLTSLATQAPAQFSFNQSDLQNDPGYQFTLSQGQDAIQRAAAAKGGLFSTGTLKSLGNYTTGTANQYFNDAFNRAQSTFTTNRQSALQQANQLQALATMGYGAAGGASGTVGQNSQLQSANTVNAGNTIANLGMAAGQGSLSGHEASAGLGLQGAQIISPLLAGSGASQAAGSLGQTNSWTNALSGLNSSILSFLNQRNGGGVGTGGTNPFSVPGYPSSPTAPTFGGAITPPFVQPQSWYDQGYGSDYGGGG